MINDIEKLKDKKSSFVLMIGILLAVVIVLWLIIFFSKQDQKDAKTVKTNPVLFVVHTHDKFIT